MFEIDICPLDTGMTSVKTFILVDVNIPDKSSNLFLYSFRSGSVKVNKYRGHCSGSKRRTQPGKKCFESVIIKSRWDTLPRRMI